MEDDNVEMSNIMPKDEKDSTLVKQPSVDVDVLPINTTPSISMIGADELKKAWEEWWIITENNKDKNNNQKQLKAQIKFMVLYEKEKQLRDKNNNISQEPIENNESSNFSKKGGKPRKNKDKSRTKRNNKRNLSSK